MRYLQAAVLGSLVLCSCNRTKEVDRSSRPSSKEEETRPAVDACGLLTSAEIEKVVGEPLREATANAQPQAGMAVSQCYFQLPTANKSISLTIWQSAKGLHQEPEEFWEERFPGEGEEGEGERKDGHEIKPEMVSGLGDEAFWSGTGIGGALYVRKGNRFFRVGIGGSDEQEIRVKKTRSLAEYILRRF